jgi:pimeloyl-ACP methyl ester carboxylesterase
VVIREAGHSAYWEQPEAFNRALLGFLARHRDSGA